MLGKVPRGKLRFEVSVVDHCNLNCKMCDHFAPIAKERYLDLEQYERELSRLSQLYNQTAEYIYLLGGEPLLHPRIVDICKSTRNYFKDCNVVIYTNGILLEKQEIYFWKTLRAYKISLIITKYPASINYAKAEDIMKKYGVEYSYCNIAPTKEMNYYPLDLQGEQDANKSYIYCSQSNNCVTLKNGRIYPCSIIPNITHLNEYFGMNLSVSDECSIDIYQANSAREIMMFASNPNPFCRYCAVSKRVNGIPWGISKRQVSEWILMKQDEGIK